MATNTTSNTNNQNNNSNPDVSRTPDGPPGQVPIPYPNIGKLASGKKHIPAVKPKIFEIFKLTKKPPLAIHFKTDEPKQDTAGSGGSSGDSNNSGTGKSFKSQKFLLHTDFLDTAKTKMLDVWNWFNMNIDLSKNVCEKHEMWLEIPGANAGSTGGNSGLISRRENVIKNWIKSHTKGAIDVKETKPLTETGNNKSTVHMEVKDYPLVLTCAVKQSAPDAPATIEIGLNAKAIILVATNSEKKEIEVKAQLPNKEKFHLLPAIVFETIKKFVERNEAKTREYADKEMQKLKTFVTEMKKKRLEMRLKSQKLDASDDEDTFVIELPIDPTKASSHDDKFTLKSDDGSYEKTLTIKDDKIAGDKKVTLVFEDVKKDLKYTLEVDPGKEVKAYKVLENQDLK